MADTRVAMQAIGGFIAVDVIHLVGDGRVAVETTVLGHAAIERRDLNGFGKISEREGGAVAESIQPFDSVLGYDGIMGRVAIVARRHRLVAAVVPAVILIAHDVTIDAGCRVIGQVGCALGIGEGEKAQADDPANDRRQHQPGPERGQRPYATKDALSPCGGRVRHGLLLSFDKTYPAGEVGDGRIAAQYPLDGYVSPMLA